MTVTWDAAFLADPEGTDDPRQGDDSIRTFKSAVDERGGREHYWKSSETDADHGRHKQGSAMVFVSETEPTLGPDGVALSATLDIGRAWYQSSTGILHIFNGTDFVSVSVQHYRVSIQGVLATGTDVIPRIHFPRAATITKVSIRVTTAPTAATLIIDLNKNGSDSIFSGVTRPTIAAGAYTNSVTSFHATNGVLAADEYLTLDIDQVGSTIAGADLSVTIEARVG